MSYDEYDKPANDDVYSQSYKIIHNEDGAPMTEAEFATFL